MSFTQSIIVRPFCVVILFAISFFAYGEEEQAVASAYFHVSSGDDGHEKFPLKSTHSKVNLNGIIATVKLTQIYSNLGALPINASYIFPGSIRAAVNGMTMIIGDRKIIAKIKEKEEAKAIFNKAKSQGKSASLLSQKRPNIFSMDVANILPGDEVKVELTYTEILSAEEGEYEFVIPGIVGPRYGGDAHLSSSETAWIPNPHLSTDSIEKDPVNYVIDINMDSPIDIKDLRSITHKPVIDWDNTKKANIYLQGDSGSVGNRDFILSYHLQDNQIVSGLTHYTWNGENYFMLVAEPPKRVLAEQVTAREYLFVVDVSGSMNGFPLTVSTQVMEELLTGMRPTDRFNILFFAGGSQTLSPTPLEASNANIATGLQMMKNMRGGGGTRLQPALKTALAMPREEGMSRSIVVITDGYISADDAVFRYINDNLGESNLFTFGIGSSVNRHLIEGMAEAGQAESFVVTNRSNANLHTQRFLKYISSPVLTGIEISSPNADLYDMQPASIPDMLSERPILVMGKYKAKTRWAPKFELSGATSKGKQTWKYKVNKESEDDNLPQLWARKRLQEMYVVPRGTKSEVKEEITSLGLNYSLLTKFTSFVAVDDVIRNKAGSAKNVKQLLPLPKGVSNLAVGSARAMPEPEITWLMLMLSIVIGYFNRRGLLSVRA